MEWVFGILTVLIVVVSVALTNSSQIAASPRLTRWWVMIGFYILLTLAICPGAIWLFVLFGGPAGERVEREEFTVFFLIAALFPLYYRVLPALLGGIASLPKLRGFLMRVMYALLAATLVVGLVQIVQQGVLSTIIEIFSRFPPWVTFAFAGLVAILLLSLVAHVIGWAIGFWVDPAEREIAIYSWGEPETQVLGCFSTVLITVGLAVLYGLVRFIKWAWVG